MATDAVLALWDPGAYQRQSGTTQLCIALPYPQGPGSLRQGGRDRAHRKAANGRATPGRL